MHEPMEQSIASLRRLARGLVYDGASAEDVVQEAWLSALKRREHLTRPQGWLANAVRWCALRARRADERRGRHERAAARSEVAPEAEELSGRTEVLRRLLDAVDRLPEPYRTAVHLRYLEDLPPRVIARRLGLPVNTARTHVRRGLELLRKELDDGGRRREELLLALAPIVGPGAGLGSPAGLERVVARARESVNAVSTLSKLATTLALTCAALFVGWRLIRQGKPRDPSPTPLAATTTREPGVEQDSSTPLRSPTTKSNAREPASSETSAVSAAWSVRGCVTRGGNEPFPLAQLVGRVHQGPGLDGPVLFSERFLADESGEFAWAPPISEHSTVYVTTDVPGHLAVPSYDWIVPGDPGAWGWNVVAVPRDLEVHGVVRALDGGPVVGAIVLYDWFDNFQRATTDADGSFALSLSRKGSTRLQVRAAGFAVASVQAGVELLEIRLTPETLRTARVVDEEGAPIEGVEVSRPGLDTKLFSDSGGVLPVHELVGPGERVPLFLRHPNYSARSFWIDERTEDPVQITLERGLTLLGRVVDTAGKPVPGAWVSLDSHYVTPAHETWTDAEGRFALPHATAGERDLWVWRNGFAHLRASLVIASGANEALELVLQPPHFVAGRVSGPDGPLAFVHVEAEDLADAEDRIDGFRTRTDRDGNFRIEGLTEHGVLLTASAEGFARCELVVDPLDRDDLELHLQPSAVFAGRVVDDASGAALAEFTVQSLSPHSEGGPVERLWSVHGTNGQWSHASRLAAGSSARVEIKAPGYAPLVLGPILSRWPADPEACVARLQPGGTMRGRVLDAVTGHPVADAVVARFPPRKLVHTREDWVGAIVKTKSDANGLFELVDLPLGEGELHVEHASYAAHLDGPFLVTPLATERTLELSRGATLTGRLLDAAGNALAGEKIDLSASFAAGKRWNWSTVSANDGGYSFAALPNGKFELSLYRPDGERHYPALSATLTLAPGAERTLDLQPRGATRLTGTLTTGFELASPATVRLTLATTPEAPFPARSYGALATADHFQLDHLEPGTYSLSAWAQLTDGRSASGQATLVVPESGELVVTLPLVPR